MRDRLTIGSPAYLCRRIKSPAGLQRAILLPSAQPASSEPLPSGPRIVDRSATPQSPLPVSSPIEGCGSHINTDGCSLVICLDGILIQARARISAFSVVRHPYSMQFPRQNSTIFEFYNTHPLGRIARRLWSVEDEVPRHRRRNLRAPFLDRDAYGRNHSARTKQPIERARRWEALKIDKYGNPWDDL